MKKLLSHDPITGKKTTFHWKPEGNFITTEMDVTPIMDSAKEEAKNWRYGSMIGNTQKHKQKIADIPAPLYYQLVEKFGQPWQNPKKWRQWVNERDNRVFKTTGGTV